jgi:hypothetical protein
VSTSWKKLVRLLVVVLLNGGIFLTILWFMGRPGFWEFQISTYEKADRANPVAAFLPAVPAFASGTRFPTT